MLNRITKHILDDVVSESQCGFRKQRGTVDMVFAVRQLQDKMCWAAPRPPPALHRSHQGIRHCELSCTLGETQEAWMPTSFCTDHPLLPRWHVLQVIENGDASTHFQCQMEWSKVACLPQRCSVSSSLRCFCSSLPTEAGVKIHYRTDGEFFNLRRLKSYTKVTRAIVRDFFFADDCALAAHSEVDLQELADCFATAAKMFGLTVSIKKTEVLRQLAPNTARPPNPTSPWMEMHWKMWTLSNT